MNEDFDKYDEFSSSMEERFPKLFSAPYGGFCVGEGWWPIVENLCEQIQHHIDWVDESRSRLLKDNPYNHVIPEAVPQVVVRQIKEKFGGLRFYYDGGDMYVSGLVSMAERWASHSCEECGNKATKTTTGWIKNLCDVHYEENEVRKRMQDV